MTTCIYCGKPAAFFHRSHKECRELHKAAAKKIPEFFVKALESSMEPSKFHALAEEIARTHFVADAEFRQLAIRGLASAIDRAFEDSLSEHDEVDASGLGPARMRFANAKIMRTLRRAASGIPQ
jgi:hypothetical protein